jgi:N-acetylneuraminic acid mutarotase
MRFLVGLCAAAMFFGPGQYVGPQATGLSGGWSDAGHMSTNREGGMLGVLLQSGRVLVAGVSSDDYSGLGNVDLYDPTTGWSAGPKLLGDPIGSVAAPLPGGGALLAGGVPFLGGTGGPGPGPTATAMVYNPTSAAWAAAPNMSVARSGASATALADGRVLVVGGYDRRVVQLPNPTGQPFCCIDVQILPQASTELFNPGSATWTPGPTLAHARFDHQVVTLKDGRILVVGGSDNANHPNRPLDSAELFDPKAGKWLGAGTIGAPRTQFTLTALSDGRALLAGGATADGSAVLRSTLLYDPVANQWLPGPDLANARAGHAAALLRDGRVLVTGGADQLGRLSSSELLNSAATSWSPSGALPGPRSYPLAVSLPSGRVLVTGGRGPSGGVSTAELFDPSAIGAPGADRAPAGPGRWRPAAPAPVLTYAQTAQLLPGDRVLVVPESAYETFNAQLYDPAADAWTTPISRTSKGSNFIASALRNGNVLLLTLDQQGGAPGRAEVIDLKNGTVQAVASPGIVSSARLDSMPDGRVLLTPAVGGELHARLYDPAADRWSAGADLPSDQQVQTVTPISGGRVLVGGDSRALVYDLASGSWTDAGNFPGRWTAYSAVKLPSGDVLLVAGAAEAPTADGRLLQVPAFRIMRWDHTTGMLAPAQSAPMAAANSSTAVLADGTVLVAGGNPAISGDPLPTAQIYNPATRSWSGAASLPIARAQAATVTLADGRVVLVGGLGMFYGSSLSLIYTPQPKAAPAATTGSTTSAAVVDLLIAAAVVLLAGRLVARARRRNRAR